MIKEGLREWLPVRLGAQPGRLGCAVIAMRRKFGKDGAKQPINVSIVLATF
jgi:hypothetical protein